MKRQIAILLSLLTALQLCACGQLDRLKEVELPPLPQVTERPAAQEPAADGETAPAQETAPEETVRVEDEEYLRRNVIVNFRKTEMIEYDPAEGEQKILSFSYVTPYVTIPEREGAAAAINEYIAMLDEGFYTGNDYGDGASAGYYGMLEQAEDNFTYVREMGAELPLEFACERDADVIRADGRVLSLMLGTYSYTGGAHGSYVSRAYVFDTETGEILTLDRLSEDPESLKAYLVPRMQEMVRGDEQLNEAVSSYLNEEDWEKSFTALLREGNWYLSKEGLVVFSDQYEITPYAAGSQSFLFPYGELGSMLAPKYRCGAKTGSGSFTIVPLESVEDGSLPILDMLTTEDDAAQICLRSGERSYDVRITRAAYSEDAGWFYRGDPLWYCSCMESSGVQLSVDIPNGYPNLALSYVGEGGQQHLCLVTQSGEDGSFLLMEEGVKFSPYN